MNAKFLTLAILSSFFLTSSLVESKDTFKIIQVPSTTLSLAKSLWFQKIKPSPREFVLQPESKPKNCKSIKE